MYLDKIKEDGINYANIITILNLPHELILNTKEYFLIYFPEGDIYYAGCDEKSGKDEELCKKINEIGYRVLSTPSEKIAKGLNSKWSKGYLQYVYRGDIIKESESKMTVLKDEDLDYVQETYRRSEYMVKLHKNKKIWGYYENNVLIGYVMEHANGSTGGLFVKPEFRNKGYGTLILKEGYSRAKEYARFSQVDFENISSIKAHEKLKCIKCDVTIYWNSNR
jgi:GNAT superfamily N-acetyltransferase